MTNKKKLIKFLKLKNSFIKQNTQIDYTNEKDINDIKRWSNEKCKQVYNIIYENIMHHNAYRLYLDTCPWCILGKIKHGLCSVKACGECQYGKNHGICGTEGSSYNKYADQDIGYKLTNKVYQNMIKQIEELR